MMRWMVWTWHRLMSRIERLLGTPAPRPRSSRPMPRVPHRTASERYWALDDALKEARAAGDEDGVRALRDLMLRLWLGMSPEEQLRLFRNPPPR